MTKKLDLNRLIVDVEVDGIDTRDAPEFCDAYILSAVWDDTGLDLTEDELDLLNEEDDFVYQAVVDYIY